jgi:hypothetical protein
MSDIRRQTEAWQKEATRDFALQKTHEGLAAYDKRDCVHQYETKSTAIAAMVARWDETRSQNQNETHIMLAYTRAEVKSLNESARTIRQQQGELGKDHSFTVERGERQFAEGDRLYFLKNENKSLSVKNGSLATITHIEGERITARLDGKEQREVSFNLKEYNHIDHGYAATVHKSQGITVDRTQVLASKHFDRHTSYVAMSRHKESCAIYYSKEAFANNGELSRGLSREGAKDVSIDYALRHNVDVEKSLSTSQSREDHFIQKPKQEQDKTESRHHNKDASDAQNILSAIKDRENNRSPLETESELLKKAEARLEQRQFANASEKDRARIEAKTGLAISTEALQEGEKGIYRGVYEVAGRSYGLMEKEDGTAKLIPAQHLESRERGHPMHIEKHTRSDGKEQFKGVQAHVRARERDNDLGLSY